MQGVRIDLGPSFFFLEREVPGKRLDTPGGLAYNPKVSKDAEGAIQNG